MARNECHRRLRERASSAPLDEADEMTDDAPEVGASAEKEELRALVQAALAGLNPGEREIIELNLRHELDGADLAATLGVSRNQAHALASRARSQFETSLGTLLVARSAPRACPDLTAMLSGWDGRLTVLVRKRVNRHIEGCATCAELRRQELNPAMLLTVLPVVLLPSSLRQQVLRLVADSSPDAADYRAWVIERADPFERSGFPRPLDVPAPGRRLASYALMGAAAVALLALLGGGAVFAADMMHHSGGPPASPSATPDGTALAAGATPSATAASSAAHRAKAAISPSATPSVSVSAITASPTPSRRPSVSPSPRPSPTKSSASPTPTPPPGTLSASPATVRLVPSAVGGPYSGAFTLAASGGPVKYQITDPAAGLVVSPSSGSLASGRTVTVTVTAPAAAGLAYLTDLTVNPGGLTVVVLYPPRG